MSTHYGPHGWPPAMMQPPGDGLNGHTFEVARSLGRLEMQGDRQVEILLAISGRLERLPGDMALLIPPPQPAPPAGPWRALGIKEWAQILLGVGTLAAVAAGKLTWAQAVALVGKPLELGP